ncbi:30S ribosomal protein S13 [Patescibacteria group bacterium]
MRISGINIPDNKRIVISLTYLYGIGPSVSTEVLQIASISPDKKTKDLSQEEYNKLVEIIKTRKTEGDLRRDKASNIKRLQEIKAYRGVRHSKNLPTKGQRTKTNSRTRRPYKGRKTMTSGRRKMEKK